MVRQGRIMPAAFDEMTLSDGTSRPGYEFLKHWLDSTPPGDPGAPPAEAELLFRRIGITFAVYGETEAEERIIPFDIIPRILTRTEWQRLVPRPRAARHARSTPSSPTLRHGRDPRGPASSPPTSSTATPTSGRRWRA